MKKGLVLLLAMFSTLNLFSQDLIFEREMTLKSFINDKREAFPIVNPDNNEIALFLLDNKVIHSLLLSSEYDLIGNYISDRPTGPYETLLGHSVASEIYYLYFSNSNKNKFYTESIDVSGQRSMGKLQKLKLKNEKLLETISYQNKFYLLTIKKKSSIIKIYVFEGDELSSIEVVDLSAYSFSNSAFPQLYYVLSKSESPVITTINIGKIDNKNPNSLDLTAQENKLYCYDNKVYITLDHAVENTKLITIDLQDFSSTFKFYDQANTSCGYSDRMKSNSYLHNNILYQIIGCQQELYFSAYDLQKDMLLKDFTIKENEEISFKNTPVIQEGGTSIYSQGVEKELEKTKQILRKIAKSNLAISVYSSKHDLEISLGGYKEVQSAGGGAPGMVMNNSSFGAPTYYYNPTYYGFSKYSNARTVYFKTLLDKGSFEHVKGEVPENAFDKIQHYRYINTADKSSETIFACADYYVFGYYDKSAKKYYLKKFLK